VAGQGEHLHPGGDLHGEGHDLAPDLVRREALQRQGAQSGVFGDAEPVFAAGPAPVARLEVGELGPGSAGGGVGRERGEAVPARVGDPQLRTGVRSLLADDDPHPGGPGGQVEQVGELGDPRTVAHRVLGVMRLGPDFCWDPGEQVRGVVGRGERLLVYGEILGSAGWEGVFGSLADIRERTDGVLWTGPPNSNVPRGASVERRDPGTSETTPVYTDGRVRRFVGTRADLAHPRPRERVEPGRTARTPRLARRLGSRPVRRGGDDVASRRDLLAAEEISQCQAVPDGYGHNYDELILDGWVAVAAPPGWTNSDPDTVRMILAEEVTSDLRVGHSPAADSP